MTDQQQDRSAQFVWDMDGARRMRKDYEAGDSIRTLAADYGVSYTTAHKMLAAAGATFRARGYTAKISEEKVAAVVADYRKGGYTFGTLAKKHRITKSRAWHIVRRRANIPPATRT